MMWHQKTAQSWVFGVLAVATLGYLMCSSAPASAYPVGSIAVAGEPDRDGDAGEPSGPESPGAAQRRHDQEEPSEDGTEDGASPSAPEGPPGCTFQGGPLELFV
jgi:hypothetical protein